eukprot:CAMPEP_0174757300 /NCGR_PEP_ID=MMETSP1094-20130205/107190_1 /TAXON_ID=156173 /ORGANISM="Chrysochromulina brevifilum, Strain UTEX LB 985" /LENGTH=134 /DNA_ID=CAMNT_0015963217 /DNA_START=1142 /DNA_END=1543 /DNA_ORIENTATION=-
MAPASGASSSLQRSQTPIASASPSASHRKSGRQRQQLWLPFPSRHDVLLAGLLKRHSPFSGARAASHALASLVAYQRSSSARARRAADGLAPAACGSQEHREGLLPLLAAAWGSSDWLPPPPYLPSPSHSMCPH